MNKMKGVLGAAFISVVAGGAGFGVMNYDGNVVHIEAEYPSISHTDAEKIKNNNAKVVGITVWAETLTIGMLGQALLRRK